MTSPNCASSTRAIPRRFASGRVFGPYRARQRLDFLGRQSSRDVRRCYRRGIRCCHLSTALTGFGESHSLARGVACGLCFGDDEDRACAPWSTCPDGAPEQRGRNETRPASTEHNEIGVNLRRHSSVAAPGWP